MYFDNVLKANDYEAADEARDTAGSNIVLGRLRVDNHESGKRYGDFTIDYFTIWDKPLSEAERNLL